MTRSALIVAASLAAAVSACSHAADRQTQGTDREQRSRAAPSKEQRDDAQPRSWQQSFALSKGSSARRFAITAPDPATHRFEVRVEQRPAEAQLYVSINTAYGNLPAFDSYEQPFMVSNAVECEDRGAARACLMRFPTFVAERAGRWTVSVKKFSNARAAVRVEVTFAPARAPNLPRRAAQGSLQAKQRFERNGIAFHYPHGWFITTQPLSSGANPIYRLAVSSVPVRRTAADTGPCLPGVARQLPPDSVLLYLREALGSDRARSLPRMDPRPASFPLPPPGGGLCGFEQGSGSWHPFKHAGRAFYLGVYVGPEASAASRRALKSLLDGMAIHAR